MRQNSKFYLPSHNDPYFQKSEDFLKDYYNTNPKTIFGRKDERNRYPPQNSKPILNPFPQHYPDTQHNSYFNPNPNKPALNAPLKVEFSGVYGCVTRPSLTCVDRQNNTTDNAYLSKIMRTEDYQKEIKYIEEINRIDKNNYYHMPPIRTCQPAITDSEYSVLNRQCTKPPGLRNVPKENLKSGTMLVVMDDLGKNWEKFAEQTHLTLENIKDFLISSYNVVRGVQHMGENDFIHDDIKFDNIVYSIEKNRSNLIDFGLSGLKNTMIQQRLKSKFEKFLWWPNYSPEKYFQYGIVFAKLQPFFKDEKNFRNTKENLDWFKSYNSQEGYYWYKSNLGRITTPEQTKIDNEIVEILRLVKDSSYDQFVLKTLDKVDVYGIAYSFVVVTQLFLHYNPKLNTRAVATSGNEEQAIVNLVHNIRRVARETANVDPITRPTAKKFAQMYEDCVMDTLAPAFLPKIDTAQSSTLDLYQNNYRGDWVQDSEFVSKYEDILKLDLVDFVRTGYFSSQGTPSNASIIADVENYYTANHETDPAATSKSLNGSTTFSFYNNRNVPNLRNIRQPQLHSPLIQNKQPEIAYCNLLGSLYTVYISDISDPILNNAAIQNELVPCIFLDAKNQRLLIQWKSLSITTSANLVENTRGNAGSVNQIFMPLSMFSSILNDGNDQPQLVPLSLALASELVCLALVEMLLPRMHDPRSDMVKKIVSIICDPTINDSGGRLAKINGNDTRNDTVEEFNRIVSSLVSSLLEARSKYDPNLLLNAYNARLRLCLVRNGVANEESARIRDRKVLFFPDFKNRWIKSRPNNITKLREIQAEYRAHHDQQPFSKDPFFISNQAAHMTKIQTSMQEMFKDMDGKDVAFVYKGFDVSVHDIHSLLELITKGTGQDRSQYFYFSEDVADRINDMGKSNDSVHCVEVYTPKRVSSMLHHDNKKYFEHLVERLILTLTKKVGAIYVMFEHLTNKDTYLLHGLKLRHDVARNEYELVILVPEPCVFEILHLVTWRFVQQLRKLLCSKTRSNVSLCKEYNTLLSQDIYSSKEKVYVSIREALFQVDLISHNTSRVSMDDWFRDQHYFILRKMFFSSTTKH